MKEQQRVHAGLWAVATVLVVAGMAKAAPLGDRASGQAVVVNGTTVSVVSGHEAFVYCHVLAGVAMVGRPSAVSIGAPGEGVGLHNYTVGWLDPQGQPVPRWRGPMQRVFSMGYGAFLPHAYLVFHDFADNGTYTCTSTIHGQVVSSATITVQETPRTPVRVKNQKNNPVTTPVRVDDGTTTQNTSPASVQHTTTTPASLKSNTQS